MARLGPLLAVSLLLAAGLRFAGIAHGWPRNYVPDTTVVRAALSLGAGANPFYGDPLPTQYPYLLPYLLAGIYGAFFVCGAIVGAFADLRSFETFAYEHPEAFFLIARCVIAAFGCLQVWLVATIARRLFDPPAAWMAAMFCATSLLLVQLSQQARPHIVATTLVLWSADLALRHWQAPRRGTLYLSWLACGLASATVPNALPSIAIPLLAGLLTKGPDSPLRATILGGAIVLAVLGLCYPGLVISPGRGFGYDSSTGVMRYFGGLYVAPKFLNGKGFPQLLTWLALYEPVLLTFAGFGILAVLRRRPKAPWLFLGIYPLLYLAIYGSYQVIHPRYLVAVLPFLAIFAGAAAAGLERRIAATASPAWASAFAVALFLLPVTQALRLDYVLLHDDTRNLAEAWITRHLGASRLIALEAHGVDLPPRRDSLERMATRSPAALGVRDRRRMRTAAPDQGFPILRLWDIAEYRERPVESLQSYGDVDHVVVVKGGEGERVDPFYASVRSRGRLLLRVDPFHPSSAGRETLLPLELRNPLLGLWQIERTGPVVEIFELGRG